MRQKGEVFHLPPYIIYFFNKRHKENSLPRSERQSVPQLIRLYSFGLVNIYNPIPCTIATCSTFDFLFSCSVLDQFRLNQSGRYFVIDITLEYSAFYLHTLTHPW